MPSRPVEESLRVALLAQVLSGQVTVRVRTLGGRVATVLERRQRGWFVVELDGNANEEGFANERKSLRRPQFAEGQNDILNALPIRPPTTKQQYSPVGLRRAAEDRTRARARASGVGHGGARVSYRGGAPRGGSADPRAYSIGGAGAGALRGGTGGGALCGGAGGAAHDADGPRDGRVEDAARLAGAPGALDPRAGVAGAGGALDARTDLAGARASPRRPESELVPPPCVIAGPSPFLLCSIGKGPRG